MVIIIVEKRISEQLCAKLTMEQSFSDFNAKLMNNGDTSDEAIIEGAVCLGTYYSCSSRSEINHLFLA